MTRILPALLVCAIGVAPVAAGADGVSIVGDWCGIDGYAIQVRAPDQVRFQPRTGMYAAPAHDVTIGDGYVSYFQNYPEEGVDVACRLTAKDPMNAVETCNVALETFYPDSSETAELHRCFPPGEPSV